MYEMIERRKMTEALAAALDALTVTERAVIIRHAAEVVDDFGAPDFLAALWHGIAQEVAALADRDAGTLAALAAAEAASVDYGAVLAQSEALAAFDADQAAYLDEVESRFATPMPPATGGVMFFDPETGVARVCNDTTTRYDPE